MRACARVCGVCGVRVCVRGVCVCVLVRAADLLPSVLTAVLYAVKVRASGLPSWPPRPKDVIQTPRTQCVYACASGPCTVTACSDLDPTFRLNLFSEDLEKLSR